MDIRVIEATQTPLRTMTPQAVAEGRQTVIVWLPRPITLQIESVLVTFPEGNSEAVRSVANVLRELGGKIVGSSITDDPKPSGLKGMSTPTRGGLAGSIRFRI